MSRQTATAEITEQRDEPGPSLRITAPESEIQPSVQANVVLGQGRRENCFLLMVTGLIDTVELISVPNVYCKYYYVFGADWRQVGGIEEGISATGYKPSRGHRIVLNTPIEATFSSKNPFRWPQIVLSLYGQDIFGNDVIRGYTATHLPMAPGKIKRKCPLFLPQASTAVQRLIGLFTGRRAEFVDPRILATAESRDVIRVSTQGFVELTLNAVLRDIKKIGYDISAQTMMKFSEFPLDWPLSSNRIGQLISQEPFVEEKRQTVKGRTIETIQEIEEEREQSSSGAYHEIVNVETMVEEI